jgi:hypothetical protein
MRTAKQIHEDVVRTLREVNPELAEEMRELVLEENKSRHKPWTGSLLRKLDYPAPCRACNEIIPAEEMAVWIRNVGAWHKHHYGV